MNYSAVSEPVSAAAALSRYEMLVELAPDGILVHDGQHVLLANAAAVRLAGATDQSEVVGRSIDTFFDLPHLKALQAEIAGSLVTSQASPPVRELFKRLDGSPVSVETRARVFADHGRPVIQLVVRDVTDRVAAEAAGRALEQRLQEAQRMEAVGALAGGVAHEVNNMMTVVLGYAEFLLTDGDLASELIPDVKHIVQAATRASAITQQLLAFGRRTNTKPIVVDVSDAVRSVQATLHRIVVRRTIIFQTAVHAMVCIDPAQLEQILVNLVLNARDATVDGGRISMTTDVVEFTFGQTCAEGVVMPAGEYATIAVHDNGTGIDDQTKKRIFEPFFSTKEVGKGTGLGLSAVHGLLRQNGCFIAVESAPGRGSEFKIFLPIHGQKSTNQRDRATFHYTTAISAPRGNILVVDGEASVRIVALRALEEAGFSVVTAADGIEALALIAQHGPPHLVVTDNMVSAVGGPELARQLAARWPDVPIVFLSAYSPDDLFPASAEREGTLTIQKPFMPGQLTSSVIKILTHRFAH